MTNEKAMNGTKRSIQQSLRKAIDSWIEDTQENDGLDMWVHEELPAQMTAACLTVIDACRANQRFCKREGC